MAQRGRVQYVLVADDHFLYRSGLRTLLATESDLQIVGEATSIAEALSKGRLQDPDIVVISASLLAVATLGERGELSRWSAHAAFVVIGDSTIAGCDDIGSLSFIPQCTPSAIIVETIRQAALKEERDDVSANSTGADLQALADAYSSKNSILTSREQEVVKLLAEGRTVRETAAELALSAKTIDAHKLNAMRKLDIHNRETLIQYAVSQRLVAFAPA